jgi:hypothetical protein
MVLWSLSKKAAGREAVGDADVEAEGGAEGEDDGEGATPGDEAAPGATSEVSTSCGVPPVVGDAVVGVVAAPEIYGTTTVAFKAVGAVPVDDVVVVPPEFSGATTVATVAVKATPVEGEADDVVVSTSKVSAATLMVTEASVAAVVAAGRTRVAQASL